MSRPNSHVNWISRKMGDMSFPVDDQLLEALDHHPEPGKDLSSITFHQYLQQMQNEQPLKALDLQLKLDRLRLQKRQSNLEEKILADDRFSMAQKQDIISTMSSLLKREDESSLRRQKVTDEVADHVRELAQTTNNISLISRLCKISRGSVSKILKNRPK